MLDEQLKGKLEEKPVEELSNEELARRIDNPHLCTEEACVELCSRARSIAYEVVNEALNNEILDILDSSAKILNGDVHETRFDFRVRYGDDSDAELAAEIRECPEWLEEACHELCYRADLENIYDYLDYIDEYVLEAAAKKLGVTTFGDDRRRYELLKASDEHLYLVVWDVDGKHIVYIHRYCNDKGRKVSDQVKDDLRELKKHNGDNIDTWDGNCNFDDELDSVQASYNCTCTWDHYSEVDLIADSYGIYGRIEDFDVQKD